METSAQAHSLQTALRLWQPGADRAALAGPGEAVAADSMAVGFCQVDRAMAAFATCACQRDCIVEWPEAIYGRLVS
jgi:hypothetical protein